MKEQKEKGITLVALVVTIIILLILAGITIQMISGNNSLINNAVSAKEQSEIDNEKEIIEIATVHAMGKDKYGNIKKVGLETQLEPYQTQMPTEVTEDSDLNLLYVKFTDSGRIYQIDIDGNVIYLGNEQELRNKVNIEASPESNTTPQLVQFVDLTVSTFLEKEDDEIFVHYAWTNNENTEPTGYTALTTTGTKRKRKATVTSVDTEAGNYYLWVKVILEGNEITKKYGPYAIKDHTTLITAAGEGNGTSSFLNSKAKGIEIERNQIESVTFVTSIAGHSTSDANCWDVSQSQNGKILAWYEKNGDYYKVTIGQDGGVVANANSENLFKWIGYNGNDTTVIYGIENLDTSFVTNMSNMFRDCRNMKELDLRIFNTSNVTTMWSMFNGCSSLTTLDVSNFNTSNATYMTGMFANCYNLTSLDVSNFNTSNVIDMSGMFQDCFNLTTLDVSNFNTSNVINMATMFQNCKNIITLDLREFDTSNVTNMNGMFCWCVKLITLDVSNFNTSKVTNMSGMFLGCWSLISLDVSKFDTSNVTMMGSMFNGCSSLTSLDVSNFNTSNVINMSGMFLGCSSLTSLDVSNFNASIVTDMSSMFRSCSKLTNESLNSLLLMCTKATQAPTKTLRYMYLSSAQATTCQSLSNYTAFTQAGWTTGY